MALTYPPIAASLTRPPHATLAQSDDLTGIEERAIGETILKTIDTSGRGMIDAGDLEAFRTSVFAGMAAGDSGRVPCAGFEDWGPGCDWVAEQMAGPMPPGRKSSLRSGTATATGN